MDSGQQLEVPAFNADARITAAGNCPHAPGARLARAFALLREGDRVRDFSQACRRAGLPSSALRRWARTGAVTVEPFRGVVYLITHAATGRSYVGQTEGDPGTPPGRAGALRRLRAHFADARKGRGFAVHRALRRHGMTDLVVEELHVPSKRDLNRLDRTEIRERGTLVPWGCDLNTGGEKGRVASAESRDKLKRTLARPKAKTLHRMATRAAMARPEIKELLAAIRASPAHREKLAARVGATWRRPGARAKRKASLKPAFARPGLRRGLSA